MPENSDKAMNRYTSIKINHVSGSKAITRRPAFALACFGLFALGAAAAQSPVVSTDGSGRPSLALPGPPPANEEEISFRILISPTTLSLGEWERTATLQLTNRGQAVTFQSEVVGYASLEGREPQSSAPVPGLLVSPRVFRLPKGGSQLVRVGLDAGTDLDGVSRGLDSMRLRLVEIRSAGRGDSGVADSAQGDPDLPTAVLGLQRVIAVPISIRSTEPDAD